MFVLDIIIIVSAIGKTVNLDKFIVLYIHKYMTSVIKHGEVVF